MIKLEILERLEKIVYVTQPSPVVLVSTVDCDGVNNVAPFASFMCCSSRPSMVAVAISPKTDTYQNIKETKEFIVGIPKEDMLDKLYKAGEKLNKDISEFDFADLTPYDSKVLSCKRIEECIVNIDCVFEKEIETGNHFIVIGKVVGCDIDEDKFFDDKVCMRKNISSVYHLTGNNFMVDGKVRKVS